MRKVKFDRVEAPVLKKKKAVGKKKAKSRSPSPGYRKKKSA